MNRKTIRIAAIIAIIVGAVFTALPVASYIMVSDRGQDIGIYGSWSAGAFWHLLMDVGPWWTFGIIGLLVSFIPNEESSK